MPTVGAIDMAMDTQTFVEFLYALKHAGRHSLNNSISSLLKIGEKINTTSKHTYTMLLSYTILNLTFSWPSREGFKPVVALIPY